MAQLKPGMRVRSSVRDTDVMVIAAPADEGAQLGKRYTNEAGDPELPCTKPGKGSLGCDATLLTIKGEKPLPASD